MRQIVLDTETTGLSPDDGHRVIEIGCVELMDRKLTGRHFHTYLNPQNKVVDAGAYRVHGISNEFLQDKPTFNMVFSEFLDFVRDAELIIHNAPFDMGFLNAEFKLLNHPQNLQTYCKVLDTLVMARNKHPGQKNNLDALCKRYCIDNSNRQLHGALLDAEILAHVYLAMTGGQINLFTDVEPQFTESNINESLKQNAQLMDFLVIPATAKELARHTEFINEFDE